MFKMGVYLWRGVVEEASDVVAAASIMIGPVSSPTECTDMWSLIAVWCGVFLLRIIYSGVFSLPVLKL